MMTKVRPAAACVRQQRGREYAKHVEALAALGLQHVERAERSTR
jgi:hypothetical protein